MKKGFFLNIAPTVGDAFSYVILKEYEFQKHIRHPHYNPATLVRSVVRIRKVDDNWENAAIDYASTFQITNAYGEQVDAKTEVDADDILVSVQDNVMESVTQQPANATDVDEDGCIIYPLPSQLPPTSDEEPDGIVLEEAQSLSDQTTANPIESDPTTPHPIHPTTTSSQPSPNRIPVVSQTQDSDDNASITSNIDDSGGNTDIDALFPQYCDFDDMEDIVSHRWLDGVLELEVQYKTGNTNFLMYDSVFDENPLAVARYIQTSSLGKDKSTAKYARWARTLLRDVQKTIRRMFAISPNKSHPVCDAPTKPISSRRSIPHGSKKPPNKKKKKGWNGRIPRTKYGIIIPTSYTHAIEIDRQNGNRLWQDAVEKEVSALIHHGCF